MNNGEGGMKVYTGLLGGNAWFENGDISGTKKRVTILSKTKTPSTRE